MNLKKRPCHIGNSMSTNTEKHGDEDVGAIDLALDGIVLNADELNSILGDGAHAALYVIPKANGSDNALPEARFPGIKPIELKEHFEKARVELWVGFEDDEQDRIGLSDAKVRRVKFTPGAGGLTSMSCSVRATPDDEVVSTLFNYLNHTASVAIRNGKWAESKSDKQKDLPLSESVEDEQQPEA